MIIDYVNLSIGHLKKKKLRSSLTIIGIFISIATIFVLISLSIGLNNAIKKQFELLGTDKFFVQPKGLAGAPGSSGSAVTLTIKDAEQLEKVNGVEGVTYIGVGNAKIQYKDKTRYYMILGFPMTNKAKNLILESANLKIDEGRFEKEGETKKVVLGYDYKYRELFGRPIRINEKIKLNDVEFQVIGILSAIGNPQDDQQVYISYDDFKELMNSSDKVDMIYVQIKEGEDVNTVAARAKKALMKYRDVTEKTIDFEISTPEELLKSFSTILNIVTVFLLGVAGISLFVGGIGIANTMYTSVLERTKEIGTMKAIGAKNRDILTIFVIESGILGLIGGVIGVALGIIIGKTIDFIALNILKTNLLQSAMPWYLITGCLLFAFFAGVVSGILPSFNASKIKPADSLRYE